MLTDSSLVLAVLSDDSEALICCSLTVNRSFLNRQGYFLKFIVYSEKKGVGLLFRAPQESGTKIARAKFVATFVILSDTACVIVPVLWWR